MAVERWRQDPWFTGYEVSDLGNVRNARTGRLLVGSRNREGRRHVILGHDGRQFTRKVARLVLMAFVGPPEPGWHARHLNGECSDDRLENLAWGTAKQNGTDRAYHNVCRSLHLYGRNKHQPIR